ncbi:MAG: T9SS type A sorting domain-containing protein [Ignavibacteriaceae bacterium]|nr:T9SS type A sorting domain-containing protein [Ignavibacteriaceae bacterium]
MKIFTLLFVAICLLQFSTLAQEPSISIFPEEGFLLELDSNSPQDTVVFTIYNDGQFPVALDLGVESADSTYILYVDSPDSTTFNGNIWRMRPDGSEKTQLTYDTLDREPVWYPDDGKIVFWSYRSGNADIWIMDSDGTNLVNLTNNPSLDSNPHCSSDGAYIIFASRRDDPNDEIYRMTSTGANVERLTFNGVQDYRPRYSPDGEYFVTQSRFPGGENDIYIYTSDGQSYINLGIPNVNHDFQPSWTPDGKRVVWSSGNQYMGELDIVSANKDSSDFRLDFATTENDYIPRYSPDGQFLAFSKATHNSSGGDEIFIWHRVLDTLIQITDNTTVNKEWGPEWSPFTNPPTWPTLSQNTVQLISGDSISIEIYIDASELTFDRHTASVTIYNATNNNPLAAVPVNIIYGQASGVEAETELRRTYSLAQNYPNPFNPATTIKYQISKLSFVTLKVYDVLGNEVTTLVNEEKPAGEYEMEFNGSELTSGIYFYRLQTGSFVNTKKMVLMK